MRTANHVRGRLATVHFRAERIAGRQRSVVRDTTTLQRSTAWPNGDRTRRAVLYTKRSRPIQMSMRFCLSFRFLFFLPPLFSTFGLGSTLRFRGDFQPLKVRVSIWFVFSRSCSGDLSVAFYEPKTQVLLTRLFSFYSCSFVFFS